jgi:DNA-directed RNA polymerase specialized sigma24 family protein
MAAATARIGQQRLRRSLSAGHHEAAPGADSRQEADRVVRELYLAQYRSLVRLAVLLVDDVGTAEQIVQDSFVATHAAFRRLRNADSALSYLRQDLLRRSRSAPRRPPDTAGARPGSFEQRERPATGDPGRAEAAPSGADAARQPAQSQQPDESTPESSVVLAAMRLLPHGQREALVLLLYLGLPEEQAAVAMRISRRAVLEHAARGRAALQGVLWA